MKEFFNGLTIANIVTSVVIIVVAIVVWQAIKKALKAFEAKADGKALPPIIYKLLRAVIAILAVLVILQLNGVNVASLLAGLGIFSVVIGLAVQDALKDIVMGLQIITDRFFSEGDVIRLADMEGEVVGFSLKSTRVRNLVTGEVLSICNRNIDRCVKIAKGAPIDLQLAYGEDPEKIAEVLTKLAEEIKGFDGVEDASYVGLISFNESSITYRVALSADPHIKGGLRLKALNLAQKRLAEAGIHIPFNQLDVHVHNA
jgi:small-conductance mechanosensitive channel